MELICLQMLDPYGLGGMGKRIFAKRKMLLIWQIKIQQGCMLFVSEKATLQLRPFCGKCLIDWHINLYRICSKILNYSKQFPYKEIPNKNF
jgi:hypothetical protein